MYIFGHQLTSPALTTDLIEVAILHYCLEFSLSFAENVKSVIV